MSKEFPQYKVSNIGGKMDCHENDDLEDVISNLRYVELLSTKCQLPRIKTDLDRPRTKRVFLQSHFLMKLI